MNSNDLNSVLSNLEGVAIFRQLELQASSLLDRRPQLKIDSITMPTEPKFVFINDAYPKCEFSYKKSELGVREIKITPILALPNLRLIPPKIVKLSLGDEEEGMGGCCFPWELQCDASEMNYM